MKYKEYKVHLFSRNDSIFGLINYDTFREKSNYYFDFEKLQNFLDYHNEFYQSNFTGKDFINQVLAEHIKPGDLNINAVEMKKLTNHRASGSDDSVRITPKVQYTLEECMEYIQFDECIEVTPKSVRMRKSLLDENERSKATKQSAQ